MIKNKKMDDNCIIPKNLTFIFIIFYIGKGLKIVITSLNMCHRTAEDIENTGFSLKFEIFKLL